MNGNMKGGKHDFRQRYADLENGIKGKRAVDIRDRAKGALVGLVVGDCLGSPVEFTNEYDHKWITEMGPALHWRLPAGYWTDDSALAFNIMEAFMKHGRKVTINDIGEEFVAWLRFAQWSSANFTFGIGRDCGAGIKNFFINGTTKNGTEKSQGNGTVMRFAPSWFIGRFLHPDDEKAQKQFEFDVSDLTHNSSVTRKAIRKLSRILDSHIIQGRKTGMSSIFSERKFVNNSGWCVSTVEAALWAFKHTNNFEDAIIAAANLGGDSDTIADVCGQIAGSYYGFSAIPDRWTSKITQWRRVEKFIDDFLDKVGF